MYYYPYSYSIFFWNLTLYMSVNVLLLALFSHLIVFIKHSSSEDEDLEIPLLDQFRDQQLEVRVIKGKAPSYWLIIPLQ